VKRTRQEQIRLAAIYALIGLFFIIAGARVVQFQVFLEPLYSSIVERQSTGKIPIPAERGVLFDRTGRVIAGNVTLRSLYAHPIDRKQMNQVAAYLEDLFDLPKGTAIKKFGLSVNRFRWIKRMISEDKARRVEVDNPPGLALRNERRRSYPLGIVGKQIVGFTDIDNKGQAGFEYSFDSELAGTNGWADFRRDGLQNTFRVNETALVKPLPGKSYVLTVDTRLQEIVEEELQRTVEKHNAKGGMAVFLDCESGDILAAAHFDPDEDNPGLPIKLRAITDQFEPGSIFKAFTAAALLDEDHVDFDDTTYCEMGKWKVDNRYLHDDKELGWLTFREIMEKSSNIGVAKHAIELGGEAMFEGFARFGIGTKTGVRLPGEASGSLVPPSRWSDYNIAAMAMGHSVATTALQMAVAFNAIANGGELLQPQLVLGEVDDDGRVVNRRYKKVLRKVLSREAADSLRAFLCGVVEHGTAENLKSSTITLAGKTGTAQIPDLVNKRYFQNRFMASFAGFFPAESPLIAGIVIIEDPQPVHYGGWTAGPAFKNVAERFAVMHPELLTVPERLLVERKKSEGLVDTPDLIGRTLAAAKELAEEKQLIFRTDADTGFVVWQFPAAERLIFEGDEVIAVTGQPEKAARLINMKGMSVREVTAYLTHVGIDFEISGNGRVVNQSLRPGTVLSSENFCRLECRPI
jgi:cell division protein FtsI/penicillin-binding protein 2